MIDPRLALTELQAAELIYQLLPHVWSESRFLYPDPGQNIPARIVMDTIRRLSGMSELRFNEIADNIQDPIDNDHIITILNSQVLPFRLQDASGIDYVAPQELEFISSYPDVATVVAGRFIVPGKATGMTTIKVTRPGYEGDASGTVIRVRVQSL